MTIEEAIEAAIVAVYESPILSRMLVLKGGAGLRLFENQDDRLSIDADFSISGRLQDSDHFYTEIEKSLSNHFDILGYEVIDFEFLRKPKKVPADRPEWWGGWVCKFKLVSHEHQGRTLETKRRNALIPKGVNSPKIELDISEHEYCGTPRTRQVQGVRIKGYSRALLVIEKLRAICQQSPQYPYYLRKNRSRDLYDIFQLTQEYDTSFIKQCRSEINKVFIAKEVPLELLNDLWDDDFVSGFESDFAQVADTVRGEVYPFGTYLEHVRFLVRDILPESGFSS